MGFVLWDFFICVSLLFIVFCLFLIWFNTFCLVFSLFFFSYHPLLPSCHAHRLIPVSLLASHPFLPPNHSSLSSPFLLFTLSPFCPGRLLSCLSSVLFLFCPVPLLSCPVCMLGHLEVHPLTNLKKLNCHSNTERFS